MADKNSKGYRVQVKVEQYTLHVLNQLIGIKGNSRSEVANFILKNWIGDHSEELAGHKITVERKGGKLIL